MNLTQPEPLPQMQIKYRDTGAYLEIDTQTLYLGDNLSAVGIRHHGPDSFTVVYRTADNRVCTRLLDTAAAIYTLTPEVTLEQLELLSESATATLH